MKIKSASLLAVMLAYPFMSSFAEDSSNQTDTLPEVAISAEKSKESATGPIHKYKASQARTATKSETPINETAQSISVVTSELIRDQGAQTFADTLKFVAGVDAGQRGRRGLDDFSIRGFVQSDYVLRDGMRMFYDTAWVQSEPFGFERVEVMKGPASVLYGQTGPGGFANVVSKRPTDQPLATIGLSLGNYDQQQWTADFSDSLNKDGTLRYRLVALTSESDDKVDFVDRSRTYIAPSLTWDISDQTSITLLTSYQKSRYVPVRGLPAEGTVLFNRNGDIPLSRFVGVPGVDKYETEISLFGYEFSHIFNDTFTFRQNVRYNTFNVDGAFTDTTNGLTANKLNYQRRLNVRDLSSQMWTMDNQLAAHFNTLGVKHEMLVGADLLHYNMGRTFTNRTLTALNLYQPNYSAAVIGAPAVVANSTGSDMSRQYGVYLQDLIKFGDGWNLQLGIRHDETDLVQTRINNTRTKSDPSKTTGKAGLLYAFDNGWSPYISYSESFLPLTGNTFDGSPFKPEMGEQQEVGVKYESPDHKFGTTFALYDLKRQNVTTTDPSNTGFNIQTGEQRHKGFEFETTGQLTDQLNVVATYTYVDAEITKSTTNTLGKKPILVAKNMANVWARYDLNRWVQGLGFGAGARYIGEQAGDGQNSFEVPSYTLFDAGIFYNTASWRFALNGRNLANKQYIAGCASITQCYPGDPRMVMLTANYSFK
ncbi:TonB-dependent siderophore receptor [Methylophilus luteus]|uniref:TonB-dependent siderophore receptor n=1 Tax=Methylophilus luteus TaxID=640108 RepID=A0ABW3F4V5_9PROT